jgi:hypothetical protein
LRRAKRDGGKAQLECTQICWIVMFQFVGNRIEDSFPLKHLPRKFGGWL